MGYALHPIKTATFSHEERDAIVRQLSRILADSSFRRSSRCREFLQYIVEQTTEGHLDLLKERSLGLALFGRSADYETGVDSIVRVRANDLRKRLAQYYLEKADEPVEFRIPPGGYIPEIRFRDALTIEAPPPVCPVISPGAVRHTRQLIWILCAACLLAGAVYLSRGVLPHRTPLDEFWAPVVSSKQPALIWSSAGSSLRLDAGVLNQLRETGANGMDLHLMPNNIRILDGYVSPGNLFSIVSISQLLTKLGSPPEYRLSGEITIAEQTNRPLILLGIYNNPWTMALNRDCRFHFSPSGPFEIVDTHHPGRAWRPREANSSKLKDPSHDLNHAKVTEDYALITRVFRPGSRQVVITAGGLIHFGTQAAAEFLSNPAYWKDAMAKLPTDWPNRNLQMVIETHVVNQSPNPPRLVDVYSW